MCNARQRGVRKSAVNAAKTLVIALAVAEQLFLLSEMIRAMVQDFLHRGGKYEGFGELVIFCFIALNLAIWTVTFKIGNALKADDLTAGAAGSLAQLCVTVGILYSRRIPNSVWWGGAIIVFFLYIHFRRIRRCAKPRKT